MKKSKVNFNGLYLSQARARPGIVLTKKHIIATLSLISLIGTLAFMTILFPQTLTLPVVFADQAGITHNNAGAALSKTSYAAYASVGDATFKRDTTKQALVLTHPKTVDFERGGKRITEDNPVYAAPWIFVDLNHDGKFGDDECVYNAPTKDEEGHITNVGKLLKPGNQIQEIDLTKTIPVGDYEACLIWQGLTIETHELATPMSFDFKLHVE